jgi:hypothetical protein
MPPSKELRSSEQRFAPPVIALLFCSTVSGLIAYLATEHSNWVMWDVLLHVMVGIASTLIFVPYLFIHIRRTLGFRRPAMLISGIGTLVLFFTFVSSGWYLLLYGQQESMQWLLQTHIYSGIVFTLLCVAHLAFHVLLLPKKRKTSDFARFPSLKNGAFKTLVFFIGLSTAFIVIGNVAYVSNLEPYKKAAIAAPYLYSYGDHPFRPSQTETSTDGFIDERQIAGSQRCLRCHTDIGDQWLSSIHRQAAADPTYVTNVSLLAEKKGIDATRYCEGCHAPVALLTGQLSPGGKHGGIENTPGNSEGVPCLGCHGISDLPHLKGVASYTFTPPQDYLFARSDSALLTTLHDMLIRLKPDQHKRDMGRPILKDPKFCSTCHSQFMDKDMNNWGWVKMQDEYGSWLESPFSLQQNRNFSNIDVVRCHDCHMPLQAGNDPSSNSDGLIRAHHFAAANTITPFLSGDEKHLQAIIKFLQSDKMRVSIETPNRPDAVQNLQALDENLRGFGEAPYYYYLGETAEIDVVVSNIGVGHDFPGGTIDINQAWLDFVVMDAEDRLVYQSGFIDDNNFVEPSANLYHSIAVDRTGKHVWKHDLFNMVGESFRRVIKAGASDIVKFSFEVPSWAKSPLTITSTLKYRKLNQKYALWALKEKYRDLPIIDVAWDSLSIPIKIRKEVN